MWIRFEEFLGRHVNDEPLSLKALDKGLRDITAEDSDLVVAVVLHPGWHDTRKNANGTKHYLGVFP